MSRFFATVSQYLFDDSDEADQIEEEEGEAEEEKRRDEEQEGGQELKEEELSSHLSTAKQVLEDAWQCLQDSNWECQTDKEGVRVLCQESRFRQGRTWRLETEVELPASRLFEEMWDRVEEQSKWNRSIKFSRIVRRIDADVVILHNGVDESAGGLVAARDFCNLCVRQEREGILFTGGVSVESESVPIDDEFVRGHNYTSCIACLPLSDHRCRLVWTADSDIKGWIPTAVMDQAMVSVMHDLGLCVQQLADTIIENNRSEQEAVQDEESVQSREADVQDKANGVQENEDDVQCVQAKE